MPHLPRHEKHNKIPHAEITRNKPLRIPGRESVESQCHDDANAYHNSPVACVRCQRRFVRQEVKGEFLGHDGVVPVDYDDVGGGLVDDEAGACEADEPVKDFDGVVGGYEEGDAGDEGDGEDCVVAGISIGLTLSQGCYRQDSPRRQRGSDLPATYGMPFFEHLRNIFGAWPFCASE